MPCKLSLEETFNGLNVALNIHPGVAMRYSTGKTAWPRPVMQDVTSYDKKQKTLTLLKNYGRWATTKSRRQG